MDHRSAILTIDVGLTNCKASLFGFGGNLFAQTTRGYPTSAPVSGWSEQDPTAWWDALKACMAELLNRSDGDGCQVSAVSVTGHMHGLIALDASGETLTNCLTLFDRRADREAAELNSIVGAQRIHRVTGARMEAYCPAAKVLWLKRNETELFERIATILAVKDWLRLRLGGTIATDPIDAAGTLLYDLEKGRWAGELLEAVGVRRDQLPPIESPWADGGRVSKEVAHELGLVEGTPLVVGSGDDVEALGAGVIAPGRTLEHIGTTGTLITCLAGQVLDPQRRLETYPHVVPGLYLIGGATNAAGHSLAWAHRILSLEQEENTSLPLQYPPIEGSPPTPLYLPFIKGERGLLWNNDASGVFLGLQDVHTPLEVARGVYEGVALSLRQIMTAAQDLGVDPSEVISGTPPDDRSWAQMRADVYAKPLLFPATSDPTGLGAALLALVNLGVFKGPVEAAGECCTIVDRLGPYRERAAVYARLASLYDSAIEACSPLFTHLAGMGERS